MKNKETSIFGRTCDDALEGIIRVFKKTNMSSEEIAENIRDLDEIGRTELHIKAIHNDEKEIANKIGKAIKMLKDEKINAFKKAVEDGKGMRYLKTLTFDQKIELHVSMGLFRIGLPSEEPYTDEEEKYNNLIQEAISVDIKHKAEKMGFHSIEEYRKYNASSTKSRFDNAMISLQDRIDEDIKDFVAFRSFR